MQISRLFFRRPTLLAGVVCIYFVLLAGVYAAVTPPFEPPDEASHFLYIHNMLETGQLPLLEDRATVFKSQSVQRHHPPLYYFIGAALISWTQRSDVSAYLQPNPLSAFGVVTDNNQNAFLHPVPASSGDTLLAIWIVRFYSILLGAGTLWFIYLTTRLVSGSAGLGLLALLLVASIPSFVHISASINNDNLVTFFHSAGIYVGLRMWQQRHISKGNIAAVSLILSGVALTKINGLTLVPILYGGLLLGVIFRRFSWRPALLLVGVSLAALALLDGWWYVRNMLLYGDPLALEATLRIWGRGGPPHLMTWFEAKGVWESFWFTLGQFNIRGPEWFYSLYLPPVTIIAVLGIGVALRRNRQRRVMLLFLIGVGLAAVVALLVATSRINVSQGRLLFPGLIAYVPLLVIGWTTLLGRRVGGLLVVPLVVVALAAPFTALIPAFRSAQVIAALPPDMRPVNVTSGDLTIQGYKLDTETVGTDGQVRLTLFISGANPQNPNVFVKALHPLTEDVLGGVDTYPGMMPTNALEAGLLYAVPVHFRLDADKVAALDNPYRLTLAIGWRVPGDTKSGDSVYLPLKAEDGSTSTLVLLPGPTVLPTYNEGNTPQTPVDVTYGQIIRLSGYTLSSREAVPGQTLDVTLYWQAIASTADDWTVAVGLLDSAAHVLTQSDGMPSGYPTSAWQTGARFTDHRRLSIPPDTPPGSYALYVGWYRLSDGERLMPVGEGVQGSLSSAPIPVQVR